MKMDKALQRWIERARCAPRLSASEERAYMEAWRSRREQDAAQRLIEANARHVVFTALKYKNYGIPLEDLISEGNVGLMKALERFDPSRNVRLGTYAVHWIRAQIVMCVLDSWTLLSGPRCALDSRVFFRLRRERARLSAQPSLAGQPQLSVEQRLAEQFGVTERRMEEMLAQLDHRGISLDALGPGQPLLADELGPRQDDSLVQREQAAQLDRILGRVRGELDARETFILERRLLADPEDKLSLGEIGKHFGVSRERVRQLEVRAQQKLEQQALREELGSACRAA